MKASIKFIQNSEFRIRNSEFGIQNSEFRIVNCHWNEKMSHLGHRSYTACMRTSSKWYSTKMNKRQNFFGLFFQNMVPKEVLSISIYVGFDPAYSVYPSPPQNKNNNRNIRHTKNIRNIRYTPKNIWNYSIPPPSHKKKHFVLWR